MSLLASNRARLEKQLAKSSVRKFFSPVLYALDSLLQSCFRRYASGRVLDVGCGHQPYRASLERLVDEYESIDLERRTDLQTFTGDVQSMSTVESSRFDAVVCSEVLEHVPRPSDALKEIHRILKVNGKLILSVPYLSRLHEEPHDYYRYTRYGLTYLLESSGFTVLNLYRSGSIFSFAGHQVATLLVCSTWHVPVVRWLIFGLNAALVTLPSYAADRWFGSDKLPLGYVVVAERRSENEDRAAPSPGSERHGPPETSIG